MVRRWSRRSFLRQGTLATSAALAGCVSSITRPSSAEQLRAHESELDRLKDVTTAVDKGYRTIGQYVATDEGVLGIPFVNPTVTELDPEKPQAVLFTLTDDGTYEPLGLKWFVPTARRDEPPSLFGRQFDGPLPGDGETIPRHYALHAWLFRDNSDGLFTLYNADVEPSQLVQQIRPVQDALLEYRLGNAAMDDGYTNTEECIEMDDGGYGVPFVKDTNDDTGGTDPLDPPVLLYRVTSNWTYLLLGAEWYVPVENADGPPSMFGEQFHEPMAGHSAKTAQAEHYGLHAWLFSANPAGLFVPFNTTISC